MTHKIAISFTTSDRIPEAKKLSEELHLPLIEDPEGDNYDYFLLYTPDNLSLHRRGEKLSRPFHIDFLSSTLLYRQKQVSLRKELLAKAMGVHPRENPVIIDATAGLGRDSFILASLGFHIILIERSPILHALLRDAIERAKTHPSLATVMNRMQLISANSIDWLTNHKNVDIIYLDPMFPERQKSASVKKEMVILQDLLGNDADSTELFDLALTCAGRRVVVKRPRLAVSISNKAPQFSLKGKSSRFDIYLTFNAKR